MIYLTRKNEELTRFLVNHRLIERIEGVESTIIYLENGKKYIVDETEEEIIEKIIAFESRIIEKGFKKEKKHL